MARLFLTEMEDDGHDRCYHVQCLFFIFKLRFHEGAPLQLHDGVCQSISALIDGMYLKHAYMHRVRLFLLATKRIDHPALAKHTFRLLAEFEHLPTLIHIGGSPS